MSQEIMRTVAGRTLRDYQLEAIEAMESAPDGAHLVQMATGLGKTVTMAGYVPDGRMLILSHRDELVHQPAKYFPVGAMGFEQANERSAGEQVVSASVQSLSRRLDSFKPGDFDVIFTDEAHHAIAPSYQKIYDYFQPRMHFGLTATPRRGDDRGLSGVYEDIIFKRDLKWGIKHGWLCDIDCRRVEVSWDTRVLHHLAGDFNQGELAQMVDNAQTNEQIAAAYDELRRGQTLIFASSVKHAHALSELIPSSRVVDGKTSSDDRRQIIEDFTRRRFDCLINYGVFTEGTDLPLIETIILARPTQNPALYTQMVGRGLRPNKEEGKTVLRLIDCAGVTDDTRLCTPATLIGLNEKDFPEYVKGALEGSLMGLEDRIKDLADSPKGWFINTRRVDILNPGCRLAWLVLPDGSRSVSAGDAWAKLEKPDLLDHVKATVKFPGELTTEQIEYDSIEEADGEIYRLFSMMPELKSTQSLWDKNQARKWGRSVATDKQLSFIADLLVKTAGPDWVFDLTSLSKYQAACLIQALKEQQEKEMGEVYGTCPICGRPLKLSKTGKSVVCSSNRWKKVKGKWELVAGCGTSVQAQIDKKQVAPELIQKALKGEVVLIDSMGQSPQVSYPYVLQESVSGKTHSFWWERQYDAWYDEEPCDTVQSLAQDLTYRKTCARW